MALHKKLLVAHSIQKIFIIIGKSTKISTHQYNFSIQFFQSELKEIYILLYVLDNKHSMNSKKSQYKWRIVTHKYIYPIHIMYTCDLQTEEIKVV